MRVNGKNNLVVAKVCSLQKGLWKWTFWERNLLSRRIVPCRTASSVANPLRKQRKKFNTPRKWSSQLSQKPTSKQAVKETTFRINCPITNLWNKQTVLRRNFFPWKASKNSSWEPSWVKSKKTEEVNKVRYKCFSSSFRVSGRSYLNQKNHKHTLCAVG